MGTVEELADTIRGAMIGVLDDDAYWIGLPESGQEGDLELATDDWSLVLESWPIGIGFYAADDEPDTEDVATLQASLEKTLGDVVSVLVAVNEWAENGVAIALERTTDPLSNVLATLIKS
ncbi:MAG: hypothetical protein ACRDHN_17495 [Thermomicrobiales bacterium]